MGKSAPAFCRLMGLFLALRILLATATSGRDATPTPAGNELWIIAIKVPLYVVFVPGGLLILLLCVIAVCACVRCRRKRKVSLSKRRKEEIGLPTSPRQISADAMSTKKMSSHYAHNGEVISGESQEQTTPSIVVTIDRGNTGTELQQFTTSTEVNENDRHRNLTVPEFNYVQDNVSEEGDYDSVHGVTLTPDPPVAEDNMNSDQADDYTPERPPPPVHYNEPQSSGEGYKMSPLSSDTPAPAQGPQVEPLYAEVNKSNKKSKYLQVVYADLANFEDQNTKKQPPYQPTHYAVLASLPVSPRDMCPLDDNK